MKTPIVDFAKNYADSDFLRLHMPGHKGKRYLGVEQWDITEIDGADVLYSASGIIKQSEQNATDLFGTRKTIYSTEGSSLVIRAMMYLFKAYCLKNGKNPHIVAGRNAHKTFVTACALLGLSVDWLLPENTETVISCKISGEYLDNYLSESVEKPAAVYVTSPDYLGNTLDILALSQVCKKHGVLLLVDNAHGAYFNFLSPSRHPIAMGADICCDSAHKTLPVLTGGAYMHISNTAPECLVDIANTAMSFFASTSPSYLILQSLDLANSYLADGYSERLTEFTGLVSEVKSRLVEKGFILIGDEPLKITVAPKSYGYTGNELAKILEKEKIICEFADPDYAVLMLTPETGVNGLEKLKEVLLALPKKQPITVIPPVLTPKRKRLLPEQAIYLPSQELDIYKCIGRVLAVPSVNCPPAIPIVVCGEEIDENAVKSFEYYGIKSCKVVDEEYI